jgi:meiotically up-regulated gene 157 (Mug157) protein
MKMKRMLWSGLFLIAWASPLSAGDKAPQDLSLTYEFVQGGPAAAATTERYTVNGKSLTLETDYIPTQYGSDASKRVKETKNFTLTDEKLADLWTVIKAQNFFDWPSSQAQRPPQSGNQTVTVKADGKTATHSMWEPAVKDRFTDFSREFLQWARRMMTVEF